MRFAEMLSVLASVSLGVLLGWLMERSRFSTRGVLAWSRSGIGAEEPAAFALALAVAWVCMVIASPFSHLCARIVVPEVGLPATAVGGLAAGAAVGLLSGGPLSFALRAGATRLPALVVFFAWCTGVIIGSRGLVAPAVERLQELGPRDARLADLLGLPPWALSALAAVIVIVLLLRVPVRVRIGALEWPKQGAGLGLLLGAGWLLALYGGDLEGLSAVRAVEDIWEGLTGGRLWLGPSLLAGIGLAAWGFLGACRRRSFFGAGSASSSEFVFYAIAGALLGLACALAGADPASRLLFALSSLNVGGILFAVAFWCGARVAGALEARGGK